MFNFDTGDTRENSRDFVLVFLLLNSIPSEVMKKSAETFSFDPFHATCFFLYPSKYQKTRSLRCLQGIQKDINAMNWVNANTNPISGLIFFLCFVKCPTLVDTLKEGKSHPGMVYQKNIKKLFYPTLPF